MLGNSSSSSNDQMGKTSGLSDSDLENTSEDLGEHYQFSDPPHFLAGKRAIIPIEIGDDQQIVRVSGTIIGNVINFEPNFINFVPDRGYEVGAVETIILNENEAIEGVNFYAQIFNSANLKKGDLVLIRCTYPFKTQGLITRGNLGEDYMGNVPHHRRLYRYYYYRILYAGSRHFYRLEDPFGLSPPIGLTLNRNSYLSGLWARSFFENVESIFEEIVQCASLHADRARQFNMPRIHNGLDPDNNPLYYSLAELELPTVDASTQHVDIAFTTEAINDSVSAMYDLMNLGNLNVDLNDINEANNDEFNLHVNANFNPSSDTESTDGLTPTF